MRIGYMTDMHLEFEKRGPDHPTATRSGASKSPSQS